MAWSEGGANRDETDGVEGASWRCGSATGGGMAGEGLGRPESTIISPASERETAILRAIGEVPVRFLAWGWRGRGGASAGGLSSARGGLVWRGDEEEDTVPWWSYKGLLPGTFSHKERSRGNGESGGGKREEG